MTSLSTADKALDSGRRARPTKRSWTKAEEKLLAELYPDTPLHRLLVIFNRSESAIYGKAFGLGLKRSEAFMSGPFAGRIKPGADIGRGARFEKGHTAWNKGIKGFNPGGRAADTQFKPGQVNGKAALLLQPLGTERITKDGIRQRKIREDGPAKQRWRACHAILWEEHHGPIPAGHIVVFCDRDTTRIEIENLELITRAENMRRNTIHRYPPELKEVIQLKKKIERKIRSLIDEKQDDRRAQPPVCRT